MLRIGIIGTESSHAEAFAGLIEQYPDRATVAAVLDEGDGKGHKLAQNHCDAQVCDSLTDMLPLTDAVMLFYRDAERHFAPAKQILEAGVSLFLDKPLTPAPVQTRELLAIARTTGAVLDGGSTCRFCADVLAMGDTFRTLRRESKALAGQINYMGHPDSPYGGVLFYGPHAMSIVAEVFGRDARAVYACRQGLSLTALVRYDDFLVTAQMADCQTSYGEIFTPDDVVRSKFGFADIYEKGFLHFLTRAESGSSTDEDELLAPVRYLDALRRSLQSGAEERVAY